MSKTKYKRQLLLFITGVFLIGFLISLDMYPSGIWSGTFGTSDMKSKAYEVLAPILEKYGEIDLGDYRKGNA